MSGRGFYSGTQVDEGFGSVVLLKDTLLFPHVTKILGPDLSPPHPQGTWGPGTLRVGVVGAHVQCVLVTGVPPGRLRFATSLSLGTPRDSR